MSGLLLTLGMALFGFVAVPAAAQDQPGATTAAPTDDVTPLFGIYPTCDSYNTFWYDSSWSAHIPTKNTTDSPTCNMDEDHYYKVPTSALQYHLNECHRAGLEPDGIYGPLTAAAVEAVQRKYGLRDDGIYGPATGQAMTWAFSYNANPGAHDPVCRRLN